MMGIIIPKTGLGEDPVEIMEILVEVGEQVVPDQALLRVESGKANFEIAAESAGTVLEILVEVGDECDPGTEVIRLA